MGCANVEQFILRSMLFRFLPFEGRIQPQREAMKSVRSSALLMDLINAALGIEFVKHPIDPLELRAGFPVHGFEPILLPNKWNALITQSIEDVHWASLEFSHESCRDVHHEHQ